MVLLFLLLRRHRRLKFHLKRKWQWHTNSQRSGRRMQPGTSGSTDGLEEEGRK
jgi:hypothetical protein